MKAPVPTEEAEQRALVQWLDLHGILYTATANGARTSWSQARKLKATGVKAGVPDLLILDPPKVSHVGRWWAPHSVAIEMKRRKGGTVSKEQNMWINALKDRGWEAFVAHGADQAIEMLKALGYGTRTP